MPKISISLKLQNEQLQEDLMYYKGENVYLRGRTQDLEDEICALKDKIERLNAK